VKIPANVIVAMDRGGANHENSKLDRAYKHRNSTLPKNYFGPKFTASPWGADSLVRELRNLSPASAKQNLVVSYAQLGTPLLGRSEKSEAMRFIIP